VLQIRRRRWAIAAAVTGALIVIAAISIAGRIPFSSDALRNRVAAAIAERLDAEVQLRGLTLRIFPRMHATGEGLTVRFQNRHDVPPLVSIERFTIDADLIGLWRRRIARVALNGLAINIPPDKDDDRDPQFVDQGVEKPDDDPDRNSAPEPGSRAGADAASESVADSYARDVVIEQLDAPDATLTILRSDPAKQPRVWYLHRLTLRSVGLLTKMPFDAVLTNAVPPGQIATEGSFGPWQRRRPGATPLQGSFTFQNADLSVFKGISGILSATGTYDGSLDRIVVNGQTRTPDFMVNLSGHQVPLQTTYRAIVDATNGNTTLDPVDATVLDTNIVARGGVYEVDGVDGRVVKLDVTIEDGKLDDVMRMAVNTPAPPMSGTLQLSTGLTIPPGKVDVVDKLGLDGQFAIEEGRFTDAEVQRKINDLSRRARGQGETSGVVPAARVTSDFAGKFTLGSGRLTLSSLTFDVPGAVVSLNGSYRLRQETLAFAGELYMDAKISQTMTGFKSLLLKVADPLFRHNGRTRVPLKISGTRNDPEFGLDVKRVFTR
jgi:hypothetical protein